MKPHRQFLEGLYLRYNIKREYFTVLVPVVIAVILVVIAVLLGMVKLPGDGGAAAAEKSDREQAYEELLKQMAAEESGDAVPVAPVATAPEKPAEKPGLDHLLVFAAFIAIIPYAVDITLQKRKIRKKEELFTEFLFKLSELMRGGLDPIKAMKELSRTDLGELSPHIRMAALAMNFGKSFEDAMRSMTKGLHSELITRYTMLVVQASYSGGSVSDLILKASEDMRGIIGIEREKEGNLSQYTMIFYFAIVIIVFIAYTLTTSLLPFLQQMGPTSFLGGGANELADLDFAQGFFHLIMINAFFGGLIIGKISEGDARYGLKHAVILMGVCYLAAIFLILPTPAEPAGTVKIEIISGDGQSGIIGLPLKDPLVVKVTDADGKPVERTDVTFTLTPGGTATPAQTKTSSDGTAQARMILGETGGTYMIQVKCQGTIVQATATASSGG